MTLTNTVQTIESGNLEVIAALDACEAGHSNAHEMLIGLPCTVQIGSDHYSAKIIKVTAKTITVECGFTHGNPISDKMTFRRTKYGQWTCRKHFILTVGVAETRWCPEF